MSTPFRTSLVRGAAASGWPAVANAFFNPMPTGERARHGWIRSIDSLNNGRPLGLTSLEKVHEEE